MSVHQTIFHVCALALLCYPYKVMLSFDTKVSLAFGGRLMHLTIIGLGLTWLMTAIAFLHQLTSNKILAHLRRGLLALAFPVQSLITLLYWGISFYNKDLVVHPEDPKIGLFGDCTFHLFPCIIAWLELCCYSPSFRRQTSHMVRLLLFAAVYGVWLQICYTMNGFWAYPFFAILSNYQRLMLYTASGLTACGFYMLGTKIHASIYGISYHKS